LSLLYTQGKHFCGNPGMLRNWTAVREMSENWPEVRKVCETVCC